MIIFPDIEKVIVSYLRDALDTRGYATARVSTMKSDPALGVISDGEVVVTGNYTGTLDDVRMRSTTTIEVYAPEYSAASDLALLVAALIVRIPNDYVKKSVVSLGPVRTTEEGQSEKRSMTVELVVKGEDI